MMYGYLKIIDFVNLNTCDGVDGADRMHEHIDSTGGLLPCLLRKRPVPYDNVNIVELICKI